jgi:dTDP-4-dehydrorhamnose 3,5-epimerase-like enzyme
VFSFGGDKSMNINNCQLITLPKIGDDRGLLSFVESNQHIPFDIKRIFYLYDVPEIKSRGAHAHKKLEQFIISLNGNFEVELNDGREKKRILLDKPWQGLYIPSMIWASVENFTRDSICLVLASDLYDEADYYRNYDDFLQVVGK